MTFLAPDPFLAHGQLLNTRLLTIEHAVCGSNATVYEGHCCYKDISVVLLR